MCFRSKKVQSIKTAILGFVVFFSFFGKAEVSVETQVSGTEIAPDEALVFQVMVSSQDSEETENVQVVFPETFSEKGIYVDGPSVSTRQSIQISGNQMVKTHQKTFSFHVSFEKPGTYVIKGVQVKIGKKTKRLRKLTVDVDPKFKGRQRKGNRGGPFGSFRWLFPFDSFDPFGSFDLFEDFQQQPLRPPRESDIRLVFDPSVTHVKEGEPIPVKVIAYINQSYRPTNLSPHFELSRESMFWMEELRHKVKVLRQLGEGDDVAYLIDEFVLFPLRPGTEELKGMRLALHLVGAIRAYPMEASAEPVTITADPLPAPKPDPLLVSDQLETQFDVKVQNKNVEHEPIPFEFEIEGIGNLRLIHDVPVETPEHVEVVTQSDSFEVRRNPTVFRLRKSGYLIFRKPGDYVIRSKGFRYFRPQSGQYAQTETHEVAINVVAGNKKTGTTMFSGFSEGGSGGVSEGGARPSIGGIFGSLVFWSGVAGGVVVGLMAWAIVWSKRRRRRILEKAQRKTDVAPKTVREEYDVFVSQHGVSAKGILDFLNQEGILGPLMREKWAAIITEDSRFSVLVGKYERMQYAGQPEAFGSQDDELAHELAKELLKDVVKP